MEISDMFDDDEDMARFRQSAILAPAPALDQKPQFPLGIYASDQWWFKELVKLWLLPVDGVVTFDMKRAAKVAQNLMHAVEACREPAAYMTDDTGRVTSDYEPTRAMIDVCRNAICREFGNNGTDGYYIRILKAIFAAVQKPVECEPFGYVLVNTEEEEAVMFYSPDMKPDTEQLKDRFKLVAVFTKQQPAECEPVAIVGELYPQTRDEVIARGIAIGAYLYTTPQPCLKCKGKDQLIAEQNRLNRERQEWALKNNETIRELQTKVAELTKERDSADAFSKKIADVCEKAESQVIALMADKARAESVIEKCNLALELNVPLLTTRLAAIFAIAAYREWK